MPEELEFGNQDTKSTKLLGEKLRPVPPYEDGTRIGGAGGLRLQTHKKLVTMLQPADAPIPTIVAKR